MQYITIKQILDVKGHSEVFTINSTEPLSEFIRIACEKKIGAFVVTRGANELVGIITERDVLYQCNKKTDFSEVPIAEVMTRNIITIDINESIQKAMDRMFTRSIRHLPAMDGPKIMGMITVRDVIRAIRKGDEEEMRHFMAYLQSSIKKTSEA